MNVLVINLTRFGDILQTQPVISAFSKRGLKTALVCLSNFSGAADLLRDVDNIFPLSGSKILAAVERDWKGGLGRFEKYCLDIEKTFSPDLVVNLTPSISARLLAMRLGKKCEVRGFALDEFGFNADTSGWAAFLQVASVNRGASPFNVVDLFRKVAGVDEAIEFKLAEVDSDKTDEAYQRLNREFGQKNGIFVGFQPGASEARRCWPADYFKRLGQMLWEQNHVIPVLLGTASEADAGEKITEGQNFPFVNLMGRTGLSELSAVLCSLKLLVTNDTGTMHLAAGLGVPIISVFLSTAQPFDTGPAADGALSLEPDLACHPCAFGTKCDQDYACRLKIRPEVLYAYADHYLKTGNFRIAANKINESGGFRAWLSKHDEVGFLDLESLSGHAVTDRAIWIKIQREAYRRFLDGADLSQPLTLDEKPSVDFCQNVKSVLVEITEILFLLTRQIRLLATAPTEDVKTSFLANIQKLQHKSSTCPELNVFGSLFMFQSQQQLGLDGLAVLFKKYLELVTFIKLSIS